MMLSILSTIAPKALLSDNIHEKIGISTQKVFGHLKSRTKPQVPLSEGIKNKSSVIINELRKSAKDSNSTSLQAQKIKSPNLLIHDLAGLILESQLAGESEYIKTDTFELSTSKDLTVNFQGKSFLTENSGQSIHFPFSFVSDNNLGNVTEMGISLIEYGVSPLIGEICQETELGPVFEVNLYKDNTPYKGISLTTAPFILNLNITRTGKNIYCSYYDQNIRNYSIEGMTSVNNMTANITLLRCSSTHLTIFSASENPYVEIKGVLEDSNK